MIDVHLDLHSGTDRPTVDYVYIWTDEALSRSFGSTVLYRPEQNREGTTFTGTTKVVTIDRRNIPVVVVELGGGIVDQKPYVERGPRRPAQHAAPARDHGRRGRAAAEADRGPRDQDGAADTGGTARDPRAAARSDHQRGQLLGRIVSPYTFEVLEEIPTPYDNGVMILSHLSRNLVEAGDYAYMVGDLDGAEA